MGAAADFEALLAVCKHSHCCVASVKLRIVVSNIVNELVIIVEVVGYNAGGDVGDYRGCGNSL